MTVCNMTIEGGGRAGMIAPDETTFAWFTEARAPRARRRAPSSSAAIERWRELRTDEGASFDTRDRRRRLRDLAAGHVGHEPRHGRARSPSSVPAPEEFDTPADREATERALHYMALAARHADRGDRDRPRVHRLVHELADRRPARRRRGRRGPQGRRRASTRWSSPAPSRSRRRPRPRASTRSSATPASTGACAGCSMCLGMNPDILAARRALRLDLEPQLRGTPGPRRAHAPRLPADGRRRGDRGALRRHPELELGDHGRHQRSSQDPSATSTAPTSTPTRSCPSSSSSGSSAPASASSCSTTGPRSPAGTCRPTRSSSPARTSAAAPRASTRRGGCRTTASRRSSRRASPTSSTPTARRSGCCRSC